MKSLIRFKGQSLLVSKAFCQLVECGLGLKLAILFYDLFLCHLVDNCEGSGIVTA